MLMLVQWLSGGQRLPLAPSARWLTVRSYADALSVSLLRQNTQYKRSLHRGIDSGSGLAGAC